MLFDQININKTNTGMSLYRPRGTLARAIFEKVHNDDFIDDYDTRLVSNNFEINTELIF